MTFVKEFETPPRVKNAFDSPSSAGSVQSPAYPKKRRVETASDMSGVTGNDERRPVWGVTALDTFVPADVSLKIANELQAPHVQWLQGAIVFADMSGYSLLFEKLATMENSAELIGSALNQYFDKVLSVCQAFKGEVIKFAGDALLISFSSPSWTPVQAAQRALECSLDIQRLLKDYKTVNEICLRLHIGVGMGSFCQVVVGNSSRAEYFVAGQAVEEATVEADNAKVGEVAVSERFVEFTSNDFDVEFESIVEGGETRRVVSGLKKKRRLPGSTSSTITSCSSTITSCSSTISASSGGSTTSGDDAKKKSIRRTRSTSLKSDVERMRHDVKRAGLMARLSEGLSIPEDDVASTGHKLRDHFTKEVSMMEVGINSPASPFSKMKASMRFQTTEEKRSRRMSVSAHVIEASDDSVGLTSFVPRNVADTVVAGLGRYVAETRNVSTIFIKLHTEIDFRIRRHVEAYNDAVVGIAATMDEYEGILRQTMLDDKGFVFICGVGTTYHEDDAVRAVRACIELSQMIKTSFGWDTSIGVATGSVFCGIVGSSKRCEYALVGPAVVLAARLMCKAECGQVLCDQTTYDAAKDSITMEGEGTRKVKGLSEEVSVYAPSTTSHARTTPQPSNTGKSRKAEIALLVDYFNKLENRESSMVLIEGQAGCGKSTLVREIQHISASRGITAGHTQCIPFGRTCPFHCMKTILLDMLLAGKKDSSALSRQEQHALFLEVKTRFPDAGDSLHLLNPILGTNFPPPPATAPFKGEKAAATRRRLIVDIVRSFATESPLLLVVENLHWIDRASLDLLIFLNRCLSDIQLLVFVTSRPCEELRLFQFHVGSSLGHILVSGLNESSLESLIQEELQANGVEEEVVKFLLGTTAGNPFFASEMLFVLRDRGLIHMDSDKTVRVSRCADKFSLAKKCVANLPGTFDSLIISRVDRFTLTQQMVLKAASVVGVHFDKGVVEACLPSKDFDLERDLEALEKFRMIESVNQHSFRFRSLLVADTVYSLLPEAIRHELHEKIADHLVERYTYDLHNHAGLIAYHYKKSHAVDVAIEYLEIAGFHAKEFHEMVQAQTFFRELVAIADGDMDQKYTTNLQKIKWCYYLGYSYIACGMPAAAQTCLERCISLVDSDNNMKKSRLLDGWRLKKLRKSMRGRIDADGSWKGRKVDSPSEWSVRAQLDLTSIHYENLNRDGVLHAVVMCARFSSDIGISHDAKAQSLAWLSLAEAVDGKREDALHYITGAKEVANKCPDSHLQQEVSMIEAVVHVYSGHYEDTEVICARVRKQFQPTNDAHSYLRMLCTLSACLIMQGKVGECLKVSEEAMDIIEGMPSMQDQHSLRSLHLWRSVALAMGNQHAESFVAIERCRKIAEAVLQQDHIQQADYRHEDQFGLDCFVVEPCEEEENSQGTSPSLASSSQHTSKKVLENVSSRTKISTASSVILESSVYAHFYFIRGNFSASMSHIDVAASIIVAKKGFLNLEGIVGAVLILDVLASMGEDVRSFSKTNSPKGSKMSSSLSPRSHSKRKSRNSWWNCGCASKKSWTECQTNPVPRNVEARLVKLIRILKKSSHAVVQLRVMIAEARLLWLKGKHKQSFDLFLNAKYLAVEKRFTLEEAIALLEVARREQSATMRRNRLDVASHVFEGRGFELYMQHCKELTETKSVESVINSLNVATAVLT